MYIHYFNLSINVMSGTIEGKIVTTVNNDNNNTVKAKAGIT